MGLPGSHGSQIMFELSEHRLPPGRHLQRRCWVKDRRDVNVLSKSNCRTLGGGFTGRHIFAMHLIDDAEGIARRKSREIQSAAEGEGRLAPAGMRGLGRRI